jgi:5-formyltetrahydrofolate cyclo-ligase
LLARRGAFALSPQAAQAGSALAQHLLTAIEALEPQCLGLYWPIRSEFSLNAALLRSRPRNSMQLALPFVHKSPPRMEYRRWDGKPPAARDELGIPAPAGTPVEPDVVLVPCVGFTDDGFRLGYGGGYFDRWLAAHPHVTAVGVAWEVGRIERSQLDPQPHDMTLTLVVTERGVT